jgi:hypothetical protein
MQDALPRRADLVLQIVAEGRAFTVSDVCGNYGRGQFEDQRPKALVLRSIRERQHAVRQVQDARFARTRSECLAALKKLEDRIGAVTPWPPKY